MRPPAVTAFGLIALAACGESHALRLLLPPNADHGTVLLVAQPQSERRSLFVFELPLSEDTPFRAEIDQDAERVPVVALYYSCPPASLGLKTGFQTFSKDPDLLSVPNPVASFVAQASAETPTPWTPEAAPDILFSLRLPLHRDSACASFMSERIDVPDAVMRTLGVGEALGEIESLSPFDETGVLVLGHLRTHFAILRRTGFELHPLASWGGWGADGRAYLVTANGLSGGPPDAPVELASFPIGTSTQGETWFMSGGGADPEIFMASMAHVMRFDGTRIESLAAPREPSSSASRRALWIGPNRGVLNRAEMFTFYEEGKVREETFIPGHVPEDLAYVPGIGIVAGTNKGALFVYGTGGWTELVDPESSQNRLVTRLGDGLLFGGHIGVLSQFQPWASCPNQALTARQKLSLIAPVGRDYVITGQSTDIFYLERQDDREACLEPMNIQ